MYLCSVKIKQPQINTEFKNDYNTFASDVVIDGYLLGTKKDAINYLKECIKNTL